jgi:hypothetical protein
MARTNLPLSTFTGFIDLNDAGTAIDSTNNMNIALPSTGIPASGFEYELLIYVQNTTASTQTVTIKAGDNTNYKNVPAFRAALGDLVTGNLTASTGTAFIGPLESARFVQSGAQGVQPPGTPDQPAGSVNINFSSGMTGKVWAILLPRAF